MSKYQCGFRKGHSVQHALISLYEKWRNNVDQGHIFEALLTDLSKVFDCLPRDIIIAYGVDVKAIDFIYNYLLFKKPQIKNKNR